MENKKQESGFNLNNIILLGSEFSRANQVFYDNVKNEMNINVDVQVEDYIIAVKETLTIRQTRQENEQVKMTVTVVGVFEKVGESALDNLEEFGHTNGAAIIFPYIREHVSSLSMKAGIMPIILQPVNFVSLYNSNKK